MRRLCMIALCALSVQLFVPASAFAWWEIIEAFSGPGRFQGWSLDARLVCVVEPVDAQKQRAERSLEQAQRVLDRASELKTVEGWTEALRSLQQAGQDWQTAAVQRGIPLSPLFERADKQLTFALTLRELPPMQDAAQVYLGAVRALRAEVDERTPIRTRALPGVGVLVSACDLKHDERRRASLDLGMRFLWSTSNQFGVTEQFPNGTRIMLTTVEPSFSWRVLKRGRFDFFDYGVGAGWYWFSSRAFPSFGGPFLEPVRVDFHAPSALVDKSEWWAVPVFRVGLLVIPGGFEPNVFAARNPERIDRDWVPAWGFFADLEPLLKKLRN